MKTNFIAITVLIASISSLHAQDWAYSNLLIGDEDITAISSVHDVNNNTTVFGFFNSNVLISSGEEIFSYGGRDYFAAKFDQFGNVVWLKNFGSISNEAVYGGVGSDVDGNIFVAGGFRDTLYYSSNDSILSTGITDAFLAKISSTGDVLFCLNIGSGAHIASPTSLEIDMNGDVILAGFFKDSIAIHHGHPTFNDTILYAPNATATNMFYSKFSGDDGDLIWAKKISPIYGNFGIRTNDINVSSDSYYFTGVYKDSIKFDNDTITSETNFQNSFLLKTDYTGQQLWIRNVTGDNDVLAYSLSINSDTGIYISGYHNNLSLTVDLNGSDQSTIDITTENRSHDLLVFKYDSDGIFQWLRSPGGPADDRLASSTFIDDELNVSGFFADSLAWGGIILKTNGTADRDMFVGILDSEGNYRSANSFGGQDNSEEDARSIFSGSGNVYTVIRSNSDLLVLGDSIYTSTTGNYFIALGIIGCLPISFDNTIPTHITGCFGDSTGSIQLVATGGFGEPWQYSIDNGLSYYGSSFFSNLPAGDYQTIVIDAEHCTEVGPLITLVEPDTLEAILISSEDILHHTTWNGLEEVTDGSLVVTATGGTSPYTFQLLPGGTPQALGTYYFAYADSGKYVIAINDLHNCGPVETDTIEINVVYTDATGIGDSEGIEAKIYPNPTSGIVNIEVPFAESECEMEVLNVTGQTVLKRQVYTSGGIIKETLDLSNQAKGLYMLRINGQTIQSAIAVK